MAVLAKIRGLLIVAVAFFIAWGMSRGLPGHSHGAVAPVAAPSPTPTVQAAPPAGGGLPGGHIPYTALMFAVLALALYWIIRRYYALQHRKLTLAVADVNGWDQIRIPGLTDVWRCPGCRGWFQLTDIDHHQARSACGYFERWLADNPGEDDNPIRAKDVPWVVRESTTMPPEHAIESGAYDSHNDDE